MQHRPIEIDVEVNAFIEGYRNTPQQSHNDILRNIFGLGRARSRSWLCSTCRTVTTTAEALPVPAPCSACGGIFFEAVETPTPVACSRSEDPPMRLPGAGEHGAQRASGR
jgi:hypothetical protein